MKSKKHLAIFVRERNNRLSKYRPINLVNGVVLDNTKEDIPFIGTYPIKNLLWVLNKIDFLNKQNPKLHFRAKMI